MKKILAYCLVCLLFLFSACNDFLDKESYTDYDEGILKTPEGMNGLLNGIYDAFSHTNYYGRTMFGYEGSKGIDFFVRKSSGNNFERENRYAESTSSAGFASSAWTQIYTAIRTSTTLLEYVDDAALSETERKRIKGETHALRGLAYFDLMRLFAYPPYFSIPPEPGKELEKQYNERFKWGVPIVKNMDMVNNIYKYEVRRETAEDTYKYIENELLEAKKLLKDASPINGHINYVATCGILTRLYLYMGRWDDVIEQGEEALRAANGKYSLMSYESYKTSYYKSYNQENLWELVYSLSDHNGSDCLNSLVRKPTYNNPGADNDGKVSQAIGYAAYGLFPSAINLLNYSVNSVADVRGYLICDLGIANNPDYRGYRKYVGESYHFVYNQPVIRLPEIYLSLAEAYLRKKDKLSAQPYYNLLRQARVKDSDFKSVDVEGCLKEVLTERRRELMLEGHTFWDFFRRGETMKRDILIENADKITIAFGQGIGISYARTQVIYPIPLSELEANKAIRDQQNPGYETYDQVYNKE